MSRIKVGIVVCTFLLIMGGAASAEKASPLFSAQEVALTGVAETLALVYDVPISDRLRMPADSFGYQASHFVSSLGGTTGYAVGLSGLYLTDRTVGWQAIQSVALAEAVTYAAKALLGRERPNSPHSPGQYTGVCWSDNCHSMPSGHTAGAFALASILAANDKDHAWAYYSGAGLMGLSRIVMGQHWPSDVVTGAVIGLAAGRFVVGARANW